MADVVRFNDKVMRVCELNYANGRDAPKNKTELSKWLDIGGGTLSSRYKATVANLHVSLERAVVMALGFGPSDADFDLGADSAWSSWQKRWGDSWHSDEPKEFIRKFEESRYFVPRPATDERLIALCQKIRKPRKPAQERGLVISPAERPAISAASTSNRYLDRLASLQVSLVRNDPDDTLIASCSFGIIEVNAGDDAAYLVSINRCRAEILLLKGSFEPRLNNAIIRSRTSPVRQMSITREPSRTNHPSWLLDDPQPRTPLGGEYEQIVLGALRGEIGPNDEANLVVHKADFAVSAVGGSNLEEGGILNSLLRYLVTEHVGEIEQRGTYRYHLSAGPILSSDDDA